MTLRSRLKNRPVIYEIVPPRRDTSRFNTELQGVEEVLQDSRIAAVNIPELFNRTRGEGTDAYSPATIPPEEYALLIKEFKEPMVNFVAPRLERQAFLDRARRALHEYGIRNLVVVGKERREDLLPGPSAVEGLRLLAPEKRDGVALGGICIFNRETAAPPEYDGGVSKLSEASRVWQKAEAGCDFVTSQITFNPLHAANFLQSYKVLCENKGSTPLTVFISLTTVPTEGILSLLEDLDVSIPPKVKKRLQSGGNMGKKSVGIAADVFNRIATYLEKEDIRLPIGLQIEQIGVKNDELSLSLLDKVYDML